MNSKQEDHYGMYLKVDFYLVAQALLLAFNPAIATTRTVLNSLINAIAQADSTASRNITGFTAAKNEHRASQLALFKLVRAGLMGYYTGNPDLRKLELIKFVDSEIDDFRDAEIFIKTDQLLDVALPVKALLVPFGVTEAQVDSLETLNDAWPAMEPLGRMEEAVNKASGEDVDRIMQQTEKLLKDTLDNYMKVVQYNNPNLHSQYLTARMIDDSGGGSGTDGFDINTLTIPPMGSLIVPTGPGALNPTLQIYVRSVQGTMRICTTALPPTACISGYLAQQGVTYKGPASGLGIDLNLPALQVTNLSDDTNAILRIGTKVEED